MKKVSYLAVWFLLLPGCNSDIGSDRLGLLEGMHESDVADGNSELDIKNDVAIWSDDSERIVIVQDNGNVPAGENRYITYDYSRDVLSAEVKDLLPVIFSTDSDLTCIEDGTTYEVTVTDGSNLSEVYLSSNKACNDLLGKQYVETSDISLLIPKLLTN